nr:MAG TPA_asm: hypothetical protein [Caudoviricetes sp.]
MRHKRVLRKTGVKKQLKKQLKFLHYYKCGALEILFNICYNNKETIFLR